ncbi:glycosyltransferase, partial [Mycobacterium avium subsp. hominissuis]
LKALRDNGIEVATVQTLADVDVVGDVAVVRDACPPASRFARATRAAGL